MFLFPFQPCQPCKNRLVTMCTRHLIRCNYFAMEKYLLAKTSKSDPELVSDEDSECFVTGSRRPSKRHRSVVPHRAAGLTAGPGLPTVDRHAVAVASDTSNLPATLFAYTQPVETYTPPGSPADSHMFSLPASLPSPDDNPLT